MHCRCAGLIWSGHIDGTLCVWGLASAAAAAAPLRLADVAVTAVAIDPDSGYCWAGTDDGEVVVVRCGQRFSSGHRSSNRAVDVARP